MTNSQNCTCQQSSVNRLDQRNTNLMTLIIQINNSNEKSLTRYKQKLPTKPVKTKEQEPTTPSMSSLR